MTLIGEPRKCIFIASHLFPRCNFNTAIFNLMASNLSCKRTKKQFWGFILLSPRVDVCKKGHLIDGHISRFCLLSFSSTVAL